MNIKIIRSRESAERKISDSYSVLNLLTAEESNRVSIAVGIANDHVETTKTTSDRAYYILKGELIVDGESVAETGDVVFIPADTEYRFEGTFTAVLVNSPPFRKENELTSGEEK
ncbi:MAG: hypothetical protein WCL23_01905 [Candidatus Moraniibacteriota bacterium]